MDNILDVLDVSDVNVNNFGENMQKYVYKRCASVYNNIPFLQDFPKNFPQMYFNSLNENVDRLESINKLTVFTKDMDISNELEAGIYEFALLYSFQNGMGKDFISSIYNDKLNDILLNLDKKSIVNNKLLLNRVLKKEIIPQEVAFFSPQQLHPLNWKTEIEKKERIHNKRTNQATTDLYKCRDCGERKGTVYQAQLRSADEPMSTFYTCSICYKTSRLS